MVDVKFEFDGVKDFTYIDNYIQNLLCTYKSKRKQLPKKEAIIDTISNMSNYKHVYKLCDQVKDLKYCSSIQNCNICFQKSRNCVETNCKHTFHRKCIKKWLKISPKCPCCRTSLI